MLHKRSKPLTFTRRQNFKDDKNLHSKSTYFYQYGSLVPKVCSVALLAGLFITLNPIASQAAPVSAAESNPDFSIELTMGDNLKTEETLDSGVIGYIENNFTVTTNATESYNILVQAAEGYTGNLVGRDYGQEIAGVGDNISTGKFTDNTWGYTLNVFDGWYDDPTSYSYRTVPEYNSANNVAKTVDNPIDGSQDYRLIFAAKLTDKMPADHYETQVMLSVVAAAKEVAKGSLGGVTKMSEFTSSICKSLETPSASATDVPTGQLIDDREGDNGTKYWVSKLADGNCWMTQNSVYGTAASSDNRNKVLNGKTALDVGTRTLSEDSSATTAFPTGTTYNGHFQIGNYYTQAQAITACEVNSSIPVKNWDWILPTSNNTNNGSFDYLTAKYNIGDNNFGSTKLQSAPLYFLFAGSYEFAGIGGAGLYWSSTSGYSLYLISSDVNPAYYDDTSYGYSVRCLVPGN